MSDIGKVACSDTTIGEILGTGSMGMGTINKLDDLIVVSNYFYWFRLTRLNCNWAIMQSDVLCWHRTCPGQLMLTNEIIYNQYPPPMIWGLWSSSYFMYWGLSVMKIINLVEWIYQFSCVDFDVWASHGTDMQVGPAVPSYRGTSDKN